VKRFLKYWAPPIVWALLIFLFSAYPTGRASEIHWKDFIVKKTAHVIEYGIFAALTYRGLISSGAKKANAGIYSILIALLYGLSDEFHQSYTPGREPRVRDVVFDTIGAIASIYSIWNILPKAPERLKKWAKRLQLI
jgi:VanZ family protein